MMDLLSIIVGGGIGGVFVVFLSKTWIEARVTNSIKHEYDQKLEEYRRELDQRQKVELVSDLLAEWIKIPNGEPLPHEVRTVLNRLSFKAILWLPADLAIELSKTMQLKSGSKSIFEIVLLARKVLTGDRSLTPGDVTFWKAELEKKENPIDCEKK